MVIIICTTTAIFTNVMACNNMIVVFVSLQLYIIIYLFIHLWGEGVFQLLSRGVLRGLDFKLRRKNSETVESGNK